MVYFNDCAYAENFFGDNYSTFVVLQLLTIAPRDFCKKIFLKYGQLGIKVAEPLYLRHYE